MMFFVTKNVTVVYHRLTLSLTKEQAGLNKSLLEYVPIYNGVISVEYHKSSNYGVYKTWRYEHLSITASEDKLRFTVTLPEYHSGGNILFILTRNETEEAIKGLSDDLNIDFEKAIVTKMEIGHNFEMDFPVTSYYPYLAHTPRLVRSDLGNGIYFKNSQNPMLIERELIFYDKGQEKRNKGYNINNYHPKGLAIPGYTPPQNLLRYELRIKRRLNDYFKVNEITGKHLYSASFFKKAWRKWVAEYKRIRKCSLPDLNPLMPSDSQDFIHQFLLSKLQKKNQQDLVMTEFEMYSFVDYLKRSGYFKGNRSIPSRYNKAIKNLFDLGTSSYSSSKIDELATKILDSKNILF